MEGNAPIYQTWMTVVYDENLNNVKIINPQHCMLLQLNQKELLNHNISELEDIAEGPNKQSASIIAKNVRKAANEKRNVYFEYATTHQDGTITYAVCFAERGPDGLIYVNVIKIDEENIFEAREGFTNYVMDISLNNISAGVYIRHLDDTGSKKYIHFNDVAKEFYENDDVLLSRYWNQEEDDIADEKTMQLRDPLKMEKVFRDDHDAIKRWMVLTKKKIRSRANGHYIVSTIIDITQRKRNEILLEQQFSLLDSMYSNLPVGITIFDKKGYLLSMNQKQLDILGISFDYDYNGKNLYDDPNTPSGLKEKLLAGENVAIEIEYDFDSVPKDVFETRHKGKKNFSVKYSPIVEKTGYIQSFLKITEDLTEKVVIEKKASFTNQILNTILDRMPGALFVKEVSDGIRYLLANRIYCETLGKKESDLLGKTDYEVYDKETADIYHKQDFRLLNGKEFVSYDSYMNVDGRDVFWQTSKSIVRTLDGRTLILGIAADITYLVEVNKALKRAQEKAIESDKLKSAFIANMSHEIRTPLNAIVGFSDLLIDTDDPDKKTAFSKIINNNSEILLHLIGDILDLSKIESGAIEYRRDRINLSSYFNELTTSLKQRLTNPDVEFIIDNPYECCYLYIDKYKMTQVLTNFVTNAIKYTPSGHIKVGYCFENNGLKLYVEDSGIGISEEKKPKVFQRFEKLDSFAQGTGLGLAISKALTEMDGGEIGFESQEGIGSTFWAWKPFANIEIPTKSSDNIEMEKATFTRNENITNILVAEDNDGNFLLVKSILKDYEVTRAINGLEAVDKASERHFDIIFMDIKMPVMDGLEATRKIREFDKEIPIIVVTANAFSSDKHEALQAGCTSFISKPIKKADILEVISHFV